MGGATTALTNTITLEHLPKECHLKAIILANLISDEDLEKLTRQEKVWLFSMLRHAVEDFNKSFRQTTKLYKQ
uniref:Uncharacterized protein n=1 Tax=Glossina palpalis gambiensis TaxID=67801 RepID=A0A1B0B0Y3_9MUSC